MDKSVFNPDFQQTNLSGKIVAGLERISEVFKILLWEKAKQVGLSPIQIQIVLFIAYHKAALCTVSHLAREFNITKPTVSDAIKVLVKKELVIKDHSTQDSRSYSLRLSESGKEIVAKTFDFADPLQKQLGTLTHSDQASMFKTISELIYKLNRNGILEVQRSCYGCTFYRKNADTDYCTLLEKKLVHHDLRLDCPEFEERPSGAT